MTIGRHHVVMDGNDYDALKSLVPNSCKRRLDKLQLSVAQLRKASSLVGNDASLFGNIAVQHKYADERRLEGEVDAGLDLGSAVQFQSIWRFVKGFFGAEVCEKCYRKAA